MDNDDRQSNTSSDIGREKFKLRKEIGLPSAVALISGIILGSGVFMTPGIVLEATGSVGSSLIIWALGGVLTFFTGLCYVELGLLTKESGAEYSYLLRAYHDVVAFFYVVSLAFVSGPASTLAMVYTFSTYLWALIYPAPCEATNGEIEMATAVAILAIWFINAYSMKLSMRIQNIFFYAKLVPIFTILIVGLINLARGETRNLQNPFVGSSKDWTVYSTAMYSILWSYDGWQSLSTVIEEMSNPERDCVPAVVISLTLCTCIYVLINIAYLTVMTPSEIISSQAVAVVFGYRTLGSFAWIIPLGVAISTFGAANGSVSIVSRVPHVAARRGHLPYILSYIDVDRYTPTTSLALNAIGAILLMLPSGSAFDTILNLYSFTAWLFIWLCQVAVIVLRYKEPYSKMECAFRVPLWIPVVTSCVGAYIVLTPLIFYFNYGYFLIFGVPIAGLALYIPIHMYGWTGLKDPTDKVNVMIQTVFGVAPSEIHVE